jgi:hypothetical protein
MHAIIATRLTRFDASNQAMSIAYSSAGTATMCVDRCRREREERLVSGQVAVDPVPLIPVRM